MEKSIYSQRGAALRHWLRQERLKADLTIRTLASQLGREFQFVAKVEQGERRLDIVEYVVYCNALEIDPHEGIRFVEKSLKGIDLSSTVL